jgi:hypothetical protein
VRARKPLPSPVQMRDDWSRRVSPVPHESYDILHALSALVATLNELDVDTDEFRSRVVEEEKVFAVYDSDHGEYVLSDVYEDHSNFVGSLGCRPKILLLENTEELEELEALLLAAPLRSNLQSKDFLAGPPSYTPSGKQASKALRAAPPKGSAPIRNSKPATRPMRQ